MGINIIKGCSILINNKLVEDYFIVIDTNLGSIIKVLPDSELDDFIKSDINHKDVNIIEYPKNFYVIPGMIDCHIHGAVGHDVMDASLEGLQEIAEALLSQGTTGFLATTMTMSDEKISNALKVIAEYNHKHDQDRSNNKAARLLGVHLEGPFLSQKHPGAQNAEYIKAPDIDLFKKWQQISGGLIKLITIAPESEGALEFISYLKQNHPEVRVSIGHSDASFECANQAIDAGACHCTHLYNAMRSFHHREPGVAGAVLVSDKVMAELIVDGVHLHPGSVQLAVKAKGLEKLLLVTDAMRARCLGNGLFDLGGQKVTVDGMEARLDGGVLAGSVVSQYQALKLFIAQTGYSLADAVQLVSENPAKQLGVFNIYGSISEKKTADLVVLDSDYAVQDSYVAGVRL